MGEPLFSIIIPTYEAAGKLPCSLESIAAQDADLYEAIVVDGASSDGTVELLASSTLPNLRWISEPDSGIYDAMNKGAALASGRFLYFLGAGDRLRPGALSSIAAQVGTAYRDEPLFLYGDARNLTKRAVIGGRYSPLRLSCGNICHQAIFYSRSVFDRVGLYDPRYSIYADWVLNMRCFADRRIEKRHVDIMVVDFEGGGVSEIETDTEFIRDRLRLVRANLGAAPYALNLLFALATAPVRKNSRLMLRGL